MRQAELVGIPIKAVVYGNSHAVIGASPGGREDMFYIPYYSTTGSALLGYHAGTDELVNVKLGSSGGYGCCVGPDGALYIGGIGPGDLYRFDPATGEVESLGGSQFGVTYIWATAVSQEGKVYCACYPTCSVLEYNITSGELGEVGHGQYRTCAIAKLRRRGHTITQRGRKYYLEDDLPLRVVGLSTGRLRLARLRLGAEFDITELP